MWFMRPDKPVGLAHTSCEHDEGRTVSNVLRLMKVFLVGVSSVLIIGSFCGLDGIHTERKVEIGVWEGNGLRHLCSILGSLFTKTAWVLQFLQVHSTAVMAIKFVSFGARISLLG